MPSSLRISSPVTVTTVPKSDILGPREDCVRAFTLDSERVRFQLRRHSLSGVDVTEIALTKSQVEELRDWLSAQIAYHRELE